MNGRIPSSLFAIAVPYYDNFSLYQIFQTNIDHFPAGNRVVCQSVVNIFNCKIRMVISHSFVVEDFFKLPCGFCNA